MMGFGYRLYPSYELRVSLSLRMGWIASANSRYAIIPYRLNRRTAVSVNCILEKITKALENGERIEVRDFGSFDLHHRSSRLGRNPKTGKSVQLPAKTVAHFKAGKQMPDRVKASRDKCPIVE